MWSSDVEEKLTVRVSVVMGKLHISCREAVVNESEIETFIGFRDIIYNVRVLIPGYVVKSCGVPFIFINEEFPNFFFMGLGSNISIDVLVSVLIFNIHFERRRNRMGVDC